MLKFTAYGPLSHENSANTASITPTILPRQNLTGGDGIRLQLRGFVVDLVNFSVDEGSVGRVTLNLSVDIMLICDCPIVPDGLWDANDYDLRLKVIEDGNVRQSVPLNYSGKPSHFRKRLEIPKERCERIRITTYDRNTGFAKTSCSR